jgi:uncharacterized protein YgiM (DUF1202 family)
MTPARAAMLDDRPKRLIIAVILIAGLLLAVLPSLALRDASAATVSVGESAVVATGALNVRTGPGLDAGIQGQLSRGTWLMLVSGPQAANGYQWYQVYTGNGVTGWVIGEALAPAS